MNKTELSIVVAVYNESTYNLNSLVEQLEKALAPIGIIYEIVFVNDGSREDTSTCLKELVQRLDYAKVVNLSRNFGQQAAISAGINFATGQAIVTMDSDLQDPPELIPDMVHLWQHGYDVVYVKRSSRQDRLIKRFTAFLFYRMMSWLSSIEIPRDTGEFRLIDRRVADCLKQLPERTRYIRGLIPWLGFKHTTVSVNRNARMHGESGYNLRKLIALAFDGLIYFSLAPLYAISVTGTITIIASFAIFALWLAFWHHYLWLAIIVSGFVFLSGLQFLQLGIVGLYIAKIFDEVRARPVYIVSEIAGHEESSTSSLRTTLKTERVFDAAPLLSDFRKTPHLAIEPNADQIS